MDTLFRTELPEAPEQPRHVAVTRYVTPLREGGSLPALAEADDGFRYVVKFRGAGHGTRALIAEFIGLQVARLVGLRVPEGVFIDVGEEFGRTEPDEEIQDLLRASRGTNFGLHFLDGAMAWDVSSNSTDTLTASTIVWLDAFLTNVDRSALNTNMLLWRGELWLIDFGASLLFQHNIDSWQRAALSPFTYIERHALLRDADFLPEIDRIMHQSISPDHLRAIVDMIPDDWLRFDLPDDASPEEAASRVAELRHIYSQYLIDRLSNSKIFVDHAINTRREKFAL